MKKVKGTGDLGLESAIMGDNGNHMGVFQKLLVSSPLGKPGSLDSTYLSERSGILIEALVSKRMKLIRCLGLRKKHSP